MNDVTTEGEETIEEAAKRYMEAAKYVPIIYVAGAISPRNSVCPRATLEKNVAAAVEATFELQHRGYAVYCPHALAPYGAELAWWAQHDVVMPKDIALLKTMQAIYFLPGWAKSRGACIEQIVSGMLGLYQYYKLEDVPFVKSP